MNDLLTQECVGREDAQRGHVSTWAFALHRNTRAYRRRDYPFTDVLSIDKGKRAYQDICQWQGYVATPLRDLGGMALRAGVHRVLYKDEASRFGLGSFKALGGAYAVACLLRHLLSQRLGRTVSVDELIGATYADLTRRITVACASDGNHGRSVAAGAKRFGCSCTIFLHEGVSVYRERAITDLGATVIRTPGSYDDSVRAAVQTSRSQGWYVVADTSDDPADRMPALVMHGYASLAIEILQQLRCSGDALPTHVFLQGGVGGLAAAIVSYLWGELGAIQAPVFVIVEPSRADCLYQSAVNGGPTRAKGDLNTLMAGLSCGEVSRVAWPVLDAGAEFFMTIQDDAAVECMRLLRRGELSSGSIIAGESGVAGLAGLLSAAHDPAGEALTHLRLDASSRVLLIGTEGATDPDIYEKLTALETADIAGE
jgi:diaminopropionate ammonia-lyase